MSKPKGDTGKDWLLVNSNKTCRFSPASLKSCMFLPPAACSMAPDGKGANYSSIWATAFIINSTDWFLQKSFFNQEFPTPRMASTQINYLRGYLGLKCIKFQLHLSSMAILGITFHTSYFCVLLISWSFWDYCNYWLAWLILNPASSWKNTTWAKKKTQNPYRAYNVGFNLYFRPNTHIFFSTATLRGFKKQLRISSGINCKINT